MQERSLDGKETLTPNASIEDFKKALENPNNTSVTLHKPGSVFWSKEANKWFKVIDGATLQECSDPRDEDNKPINDIENEKPWENKKMRSPKKLRHR